MNIFITKYVLLKFFKIFFYILKSNSKVCIVFCGHINLHAKVNISPKLDIHKYTDYIVASDYILKTK